MPFRRHRRRRQNANFASDRRPLDEPADAMRSMCGRGRHPRATPCGNDVRSARPSRAVASRRRGAVWPSSPRERGGAPASRCSRLIDDWTRSSSRLHPSSLARSAATSRAGSSVAIELREDLPAALHHRLVLGASGFVEQRRDLLVRHRVDPVDPKRVASPRNDWISWTSHWNSSSSPESRAGSSWHRAPHGPMRWAFARPRRGAGRLGGRVVRSRQPTHGACTESNE